MLWAILEGTTFPLVVVFQDDQKHTAGSRMVVIGLTRTLWRRCAIRQAKRVF
jgi:hypothetical protein